jgi:seryl-tRNA synthetase
MLDIKFIRENAAAVEKNCKNRQVDCDISQLLELDKKRKKLIQKIEELNGEKNKLNNEIQKAQEKKGLVKKGREVKRKLEKLKPELEEMEKEYKDILMQVPNMTAPDMPIGKNDNGNKVVKKWGEIPKFDFEIKDHVKLGEDLDLIDVKKAAEISGSRFYYLKNEAVWLQFALINFTLEALSQENILREIIKETGAKISAKPFIPILPPVMIKHEVQNSIHRVFGEQTYRFEEDNLNLVASAEHTLAPYHMNEVVDEGNLPLRYIGYSTAFRREAGTYGKDMGGILRVHQFDKLEMESFTGAETGAEEQKFIVGIQEYLVQSLGIPYQVVHVCTGDTGKPDYDQFDIECWLPGQNKYRETHTSDYMTDYQTRGINSFYKNEKGEKKLLHTNDATAFAIGRILIAILENYQQADGSVIIPEVLRKWMPGKMEKIKHQKEGRFINGK